MRNQEEQSVVWGDMPSPAINPKSDKSNNLNFQPLEVVSRYRDPQLQVAENYADLLNLRPNICEYWCLNPHFIPNNYDLIGE